MTPRTSVYTTAAAIRASGREALAVHEAKTPRYHLRAGKEYLHFTGEFLTSERAYAWSGTVDQARACRRDFPAAAGCRLTAIQPAPQHQEMEA